MRALPPLLCALVLSASLHAAEPDPAPAPPSKTPSRTRQAVADKLPKFNPPTPTTAPAPATTEQPQPLALGGLDSGDAAAMPIDTPKPVGDLLILPDFRVSEPKLFGPDEDAWLTGAERTRKAVRLAEAEATALELALNRWHIPYLTPSFAARARADYEYQRLDRELDRLLRLVELGEQLDLDPGRKGESPFRYQPRQSLQLKLDLTRRLP